LQISGWGILLARLTGRRPTAGPDIGAAAAIAMRHRLIVLRLVLMGVIALLLGTVGGWVWAAPWWIVYAAVQGLLAWLDREGPRKGYGAIYLVSFASFTLAGAPTWHMWTALGPLGVAAATMFLCGMLAQLVVSSLGARRLFVASAAPLFGYLLFVPMMALANSDLIGAGAIFVCALVLIIYILALWRGQHGVLTALAASQAAAEEASRAKSEFLATISHEIRTPMNAVLGASDLLSRSALSPADREHVDTIRDAGLVLTQLLNDVLDLSKIEAGKLQVEATMVALGPFMGRCASVWRPRAGDAGLRLEVRSESVAAWQAEFDPLRTGQILFNLLSNAIKFTPEGVVTLEAEVTEHGEGRGELRLTVADTGIGIAPEALARLFTPFEQADGSITRRFGGTGLGLAIGQKLATMMGGRIEAQSTEGVGSRFSLILPCALAPVEPAAPAAAPVVFPDEGPQLTLRILLAEDNPANQRIVEHFLRPLGATLTIVGDGQAAIEALAEAEFDVVLMDVQMPVLDGLEATRRIRAEPGPNRDVPIVALTANVLDSQKQACMAAGMSGHIPKPIDARALLGAVLNLGLAHRARSSAA